MVSSLKNFPPRGNSPPRNQLIRRAVPPDLGIRRVYWAVLFTRAVVQHPAGPDPSSPAPTSLEKLHGEDVVAAAQYTNARHPERHRFRGHNPTAHTLAYLCFAGLVAETVARLTTGSGGLTHGRADSHSLDDTEKCHVVIAAPPLPFDQQSLVALYLPILSSLAWRYDPVHRTGAAHGRAPDARACPAATRDPRADRSGPRPPPSRVVAGRAALSDAQQRTASVGGDEPTSGLARFVARASMANFQTGAGRNCTTPARRRFLQTPAKKRGARVRVATRRRSLLPPDAGPARAWGLQFTRRCGCRGAQGCRETLRCRGRMETSGTRAIAARGVEDRTTKHSVAGSALCSTPAPRASRCRA